MPGATTYFDDDVIDVRLDDGTTAQFYWGDVCTRLPGDDVDDKWRVIAQRAGGGPRVEGFVKANTKLREEGLLRLAMVDVQQGDGLILQTPDNKVMFIDRGDNKLFARFVAAAFPDTSDAEPVVVDAMVITQRRRRSFRGSQRATQIRDVVRRERAQAGVRGAEAGVPQLAW